MDNGIHIIKASAGSGKTYTLAKDYIKLLLCHESPSLLGSGDEKLKLRPQGKGTEPYHSHILAITFTNAATAEMKQRIIDQLYWLGQGDGKRCSYTADFKRELSYNDFSEVQEAARQALSDILFNYNTFNVSTIDSFFQSILRTFARELDCDYDYGIQLDDDLARSAAIYNLLAKLGTKGYGYLDEWLSEYIKSQVSEGKNPSVYSYSTKNDLKNMAKELGKEEFSSKHDAIHDYLSDIGSGAGVSRIGRFTKAVAQAIDKTRSGTLKLDAQVSRKMRELNIDSSKINCGSNMGKVLVEMLNEGDSDDTKRSVDDILNYAKTFFDGKKKYALKKNTLEHGHFFKKGASEADKDNFHNHVLPLIREIINHFTRCDALDSAKKNIWKLGLLGKIDDEIESYRKENNVILLKDTNDMMKKVIDSGVPFMYERVGTWINNFMIDEFQDTSDKQYHNFKELLDESCSSGHNNLIIGDEKQSIYRFRNANPELLLNGIEADFGERCDTSSIGHNYRSLSEVVNFNNEFFGKALQHYKNNNDTANYDILQATYKHIEQKAGKKSDDTGYVEFTISNGEANTEEIFSVPLLIEELRERGYRMSDIGILVNERKEGNAVVSQIIEHNEMRIDTDPKYDPIQIMSAESLKLVNSPQVQLIVGVLRFINASQLSEAMADANADDKAAPYRKKQLSDQRLYSIIHDFESKIASYDQPQGTGADRDFGALLLQSLSADRQIADDIPQEQERMEAYSKKVSGLLPDYHTEPMNLTSIVDRIIKQYVLFGNKKTNERKVGTSFLLAFQNVVNSFVTDSSNCGTIREFLDFWDQKADTLTVPTPSDADAVQIMTIHKSKGLQFKCVIIPFANWEMVKEEGTTWITRELWVKTFGTDAELVPPMVPISTSTAKGVEQFKQQLDDANQRSLIDNLNKAYVALTRAEREIYVMACPPPKKAQPFSDLITRIVLEMDGEIDSSNKDNGVIRWSRGEWTEKVEIQHDEAEKQPTIDMPQYYVNIATPELLKVSLPEFTTPEQQAGTSLHRLLSRLGTARDLERTIAYGKSRCIIADHGVQYWNAERMEAAMRRLVGEEPTSEWFAPENQVYNERSITHADRNHNMCHTRPDRVVRRPDGSHIVIDYKTGADESHAMTERYKRQVEGYMRRVAAASGCSQVEGYIIYLQSWHIVKVEI